MGGKSSSLIKRVVENKMLFSIDLESISKSMTNINSSIENSLNQAAENYLEQKNKMNLSGTELVADGGTIDIGQSNKGKSTLTVEQIVEILNDVSLSITSEIVNSISDALDIETIQKLLSEAENQLKNSATGITSAGREDNTSIDETIKNDTEVNLKTKLENYVENVVNNNVINHSDKYCGTKFLQSNDFELVNGKITAKNQGTINLSQNNEVEITSECKQIDQINNKVVVDLCTGVGIEVSQEVKTKMETEAQDKAKNDISNEGLGKEVGEAAEGAGKGVKSAAEGAGNALSSVSKGIGSAISSVFSSTIGIFAIVCGAIFCIILVICLVLFFTATDETGSKTILGVTETVGDTAKTIAPEIAKVASSMPPIPIGGSELIY